jgi:predicted ATPase/class 3 adenylate cyclase
MMTSVRGDLPSGTVTFLFTDVEGSTKLLHELGAEAYAEALADHRRVIREACDAQGGVEVDTQGDAFFFAFPTAPGSLAAAEAMTEALASGRIQVRIGLHTATPHVTEEGYAGPDVHRAARIAAAGHGGQVLVSATTAALVEYPLRDLGEHRLKDLSAPERIYQLGDATHAPLRTLSEGNLPIPATAFLGRETELREVVSLFLQPDERLLTLTGAGGTGKTRLALQAAGVAADAFPDGVWWVPLAALRDPELVLPSAAQALGARWDLPAHIGDRSMLVLLDNFEHVIEAAPELPRLLASCRRLRLVVTSRELLRVGGEVEYLVPPMVESEAVELFCQRSRLEADGTVAELCRRLDNLPLAVELAAARTRALSPRQILERLSGRLDLLRGGRDADARQETLRATIDWSYDLLTPSEQRLFARLSIFAGGCTLEAAEEVCEATVEILQALVDKSLLRFTDERYWMLETIREYAAERLEHLGEAEAVRNRYAQFFLHLAETLASELSDLTQAARLNQLSVELTNLSMPMALLDPDGTIVFYNASAEEWLGDTFEHAGELSSEEWAAVFAPERADGTPISLNELPAGVALLEQRPHHLDLFYTGIDGIRRKVANTAFPLMGREQELQGAVTIFWHA